MHEARTGLRLILKPATQLFGGQVEQLAGRNGAARRPLRIGDLKKVDQELGNLSGLTQCRFRPVGLKVGAARLHSAGDNTGCQ